MSEDNNNNGNECINSIPIGYTFNSTTKICLKCQSYLLNKFFFIYLSY